MPSYGPRKSVRVSGLGKGLNVSLTGVHACTRGQKHNNGTCGYSPVTAHGLSRCMCNDAYVRTTVHGDCLTCGGGYYSDNSEWLSAIAPMEIGRVVQEEFPITITAYRGTKEVKVKGVREDSVRAKMDRDGNCNLSFEFADNPDRIGYLPCVDWYETECDV